MKLACLRCKQKKIKCGREVSTCGQCIAAGSECVYVERRKRPRLAQQKNDVRELSRRLQDLERQLQGEAQGSTASSASPISQGDPMANATEPQLDDPAHIYITREGGKESWIYRLASDTRQRIERMNTQSQPTPIPITPDSAPVDDAILALKEALDDLGKFRVRPDEQAPRAPELIISADEAKACIKGFREMMKTLVVDLFVTVPDTEILDLLPDLMNSPYVSIDPGLRVMYYNALFYGLHKLYGHGTDRAKAAYYKLLEAVPDWLDGASNESDLDGHCALLTSFTAIINFDYQLSWKFHCKACHYLRTQDLDRLDSTPVRSKEEENRRQSLRYLYWFVLGSDILFRLFNNKPAMLRWKLGKIQPPTLFSTAEMVRSTRSIYRTPNKTTSAPTASQSMCYVVWIRFTVMSSEILDVLDSAERPIDQEVWRQIDDYCFKLEELISEWNMVALIKFSETPPEVACMYADLTINIYASIVGIRKLARGSKHQQVVDETSLRAARMVIELILHLNRAPSIIQRSPVFFYFISFYPFCAVFTLYEYILACTNPDDCEEDLRALEEVGSIMKQACESISEFNPLSNTILALNKVSRTMQEARRNDIPLVRTTNDPKGPLENEHRAQTQNLDQSRDRIGDQGTVSNTPSSLLDSSQHLIPPVIDSSNPSQTHPARQAFPDFSFLPDFNMSTTGEVLPVDFIRALETDLIGRNWHETWWDMDGTGDVDMALNDGRDTEQRRANAEGQMGPYAC